MPEQIENRMVVDSEWKPLYRIVARCMECEGDISAGEDFYQIDGDVVCENCIDGFLKENYRRCIE